MKCIVTRKNDMSASKWSGGSTVQLFIYPANASYAARDFEIRISSATVEDESSVFTFLPGYHRLLMPLDAPLHLVYKDNGEHRTGPFEVAEFEGEWHTTSFGICTDLGIMLAKGWQGSMKTVGSGTYIDCHGFTGVYALADNVKIDANCNGKTLSYVLLQGDFMLLEAKENAELVLESPSQNAAVLMQVIKCRT